jgi:hypothetical protein
MPIYLVEGPDGKTHKIEGPSGATPEQIIAQAQKIIPYEQRTVSEQLPIDWREDTLGGQFKRGLGRAWEGTKSTVTDLIPALAGSAVGAKDYAAEQLAEHAAKMEAAEKQYPTAFKSYKDIRGLGDVASYIAESLGELAPDIAAMMTGTGAASAVGKRLALRGVEELALKSAAEKGLTGEAAQALVDGALKQAASKGSAAGITYGMPASSYALNAPDTFQSIYEKTGEQSPGIAALMGVPIAMLDTYLPGRILDKLGVAGKAKLASNLLGEASEAVVPSTFKKAALKEFGTVIASEGLTESAQEALTAAAEIMAGHKEDLFSPANIDRYINAGLKGAVGGGIFGAPGAIRSGLQARGEKDRLEGEVASRVEAAAQRPAFELTPPPSEPPRPDFELTPSTSPEAPVDTGQMSFDFGEPAVAPTGQGELDFGTPPIFKPSEERAEEARRQEQDQQTPKAESQYLKQSAFANEQPDLAGLLYPPAAPAAPEAPIMVTKNDLLDLGIPKNAPLIKRIAGLDLMVPEQLNTVISQLSAFAANPKVKPDVAARVRQVVQDLRQPSPTEQGSLQFAPPAPQGPFNTQLQDQIARAQRVQEEQGMLQQRQTEEGAQKQQDMERLANRAAAQRQLDFAQQPEAQDVPPSGNAQPAAPAAGVSPVVSGQPEGMGPPTSEGTAAPEQRGVVPIGQPAAAPVGGEATQPGAVIAPIQTAPIKAKAPEAKAPEAKAPEAKRQRKTKAAVTAVSTTPKLAGDEFIAETTQSYQDTADEIDEPRSVNAVTKLVARATKTPEAKAAAIYFSKKLGDFQLRVVDGLKNIAYDLVYDTPVLYGEKANTKKEAKGAIKMTGTSVITESEAERDFFRGMTGANAKLAARWVAENLDEKATAELASLIEGAKRRKEFQESEEYQRMLTKGTVGTADLRNIDGTVTEYFNATKLERGVTIEGEFSRVHEQANQLLISANKNLTEQETSTLEQHYQAPRNSQQYVDKLRADILKYVIKGADSVVDTVRRIIGKLVAAVLAVSVAFNQGNFVQDAQAFTMPLPQTKTQLIRTVEKPRADFGLVKPSATAATVADWVTGTNDAKGKPNILIDKASATAYVFDPAGKLLGATPVLMGQNSKADVLPVSALSKTVEQTTLAEKVTPAGRFEGKIEPDAEYGSRFTFLNLVNSVLAMHRTYLATASERRQQRLDTPTAADNYISYGCINVDKGFYDKFIAPNFKNGGVMYITPMTQSLETTFQGIAGYTPTETIVTEIISNPQSTKDISAHSELGAFRQRAPVGKARKSNAVPSPANPNEMALANSLSMPLHPAVISALKDGNFAQAMRLMAQTKDPRTAKLATALLNAAVNPKVEIVENLKNEAGDAVAGLYDPRTNTIRLDSVNGMTAHTLIHETGHAALSHVLDDANHPVTKQMQRLFDDVQPMLDTAYGAQNLQEFAAEALSNPEFRGKLYAMNPAGDKINAWQRFQNIVGNFFRRLFGVTGKPIESAMDRVDQLIDHILSPAPEFRDAGSLYALAKQKKSVIAKVLDAAFGITEKMPYMKTEIGRGETRADLFREAIENASTDAVRAGLLMSLPLNILSELASKYVINANTVNKLVNERAGVIHTRNEQIEALADKADRWASAAGKAMVKIFNDVVYDSTTLGVDPTKTAKEYAAKPRADNTISPEAADNARIKLENLKKVQDNYNKLDATGKSLYAEMRNAYAKMYEEIKRSLDSRVSKALEGEDGAEHIKSKLFDKLLDRAHLDPYFPLTRQGNYWLSYDVVDEAGQADHVVKAFVTESGRERFINDSKLKENEYEKYSNLNQIRYNRVPSTSFISDVIKALKSGTVDAKTGEKSKVSEAKIEVIVKLFLDALPETAFAKSFQKRGGKEGTGMPGFERDAIGALRQKMFNTSRQIANMEYASKLDDALDAMAEAGKQNRSHKDARIISAYVSEYRKRIAFINNPTISKWSQFLTGTGFNFLLGLNPASALVNLTQVPMVTLPYLGGEYGYPQASRAVMDAYKDFASTGRSKTTDVFGNKGVTETRSAMYSLDNLDPKNPLYKKYKTLINVAKAQGQISSSQIYDTLEASDRVGLLQKVNALTGWMFHQAERVNRQVSMVAAYNLEMARLQSSKATAEEKAMSFAQKEEFAANQAIHISEMTQGGTSAASAPRIAQGTVGRVMFMFKRYGINMMYLQVRMLKDALRSQDKATRKVAMAQFAGMTGMAALLAGVQGLPFFGAAAMVYNMFKDKDDDDLEMATRKYMGTMYTNGPLSYYTNLDFSGRVSLSDLLVREMRTGDSPSFVSSVMEQLGGPLYGIASKFERGLGLVRDGHTARGVEQMLPSALGNPLKAIRFATEGANTLRGDPITGDVSAWNVAAQALGFSPADYQRQNELSSRMKGIDKRVSQEETKLLRQYYTVGRMRDFEAQAEIKEDLRELFRRHPGLGNVNDALQRSMESHRKTSQKMVHGITVNEKLRSELMRYAAEAGE